VRRAMRRARSRFAADGSTAVWCTGCWSTAVWCARSGLAALRFAALRRAVRRARSRSGCLLERCCAVQLETVYCWQEHYCVER